MEWLTNYLGLTRFNDNGIQQTFGSVFESENSQLVAAKGYDYVLGFDDTYSNSATELNVDNIKIKKTDTAKVCTLYLNNEKVSFNVKEIADSLKMAEGKLKAYNDENEYNIRNYKLPNQMLAFTKQTKHFRVTFQIDVLRFSYSNIDELNVEQVNGSYLITVLK